MSTTPNMNIQDSRETMDLANVPESELWRMRNDCRITLESIYPYKDKATSAFKARLSDEITRRELAKLHPPICPKCGHGTYFLNGEISEHECY